MLFPLLHGTFWYTGMAALPPFVVYGADRLTDGGYSDARELRERLPPCRRPTPLPYRHESGGDYDEDLVLRGGVAADRTGVAAHVAPGGAPHFSPSGD